MGCSREPLVKKDSWPYTRGEKHREVVEARAKAAPLQSRQRFPRGTE